MGVHGAFSMAGFLLRTEWAWLGVVNYCKVNDHRLLSFSSYDAWFRRYGHFKFLRCLGWDKVRVYAYVEMLNPTRGSSVHGYAHLLNRVGKGMCRGKVVLPSSLVQVKTR